MSVFCVCDVRIHFACFFAVASIADEWVSWDFSTPTLGVVGVFYPHPCCYQQSLHCVESVS